MLNIYLLKVFIMSKLSIINKQAKITIPKDIVNLKEWNENTEILITPFIVEPRSEINKDVPIIITEIKKRRKKK